MICHRQARSVILPICLTLAACATVPDRDPPCFDGWMIGKDAKSEVIELDQADRTAILAALPARSVLHCVHREPSGGLVALVSNDTGELETFSVELDETGPKVEHTGIVITTG